MGNCGIDRYDQISMRQDRRRICKVLQLFARAVHIRQLVEQLRIPGPQFALDAEPFDAVGPRNQRDQLFEGN